MARFRPLESILEKTRRTGKHEWARQARSALVVAEVGVSAYPANRLRIAGEEFRAPNAGGSRFRYSRLLVFNVGLPRRAPPPTG